MQRELADWRKATGARMPTVNAKYDPERAMEWWSRRANKPINIEAMRKSYDSRDK